jgi:hypothetical protein
LGADQLVALPALECPVGYFGEGGTLGAKCKPCAAGSTTDAAGAESATECDGECCGCRCGQCISASVYNLSRVPVKS